MNSKINRKLEFFLGRKLGKMWRETQGDKSCFDLTHIKTKNGFEKSDVHDRWYGDGYAFSNNNGCQCILYLGVSKKRRLIAISIDGIRSLYAWYGNIKMLYRCMDEIDEIAVEFRQLKCDLGKQGKIKDIAQNSINTWLKAIMQNQTYSYYTTEYKNKITLSIKMKFRVQLDIPIYFSKFQKIMPELIDTIQLFEKTANEGKIIQLFEKTANEAKIKVLIGYSKVNQQWIDQSKIKN